ncbi:MAG: bifunctional phosphoglucose/phosphomannose isomerase [Candidatus Eisenbacteria bacterium]
MSDWEALKRAHDGGEMFERIRDLPDQIGEAEERMRGGFDRPLPAGPFRNVLLLGMGGSAIGGEIVAARLADEASIPLLVHRGYGVPAWCGPGTLVVATSYSGTTEETLSASRAARRRGATLVAVTSGGRLAVDARENGEPVIEVPPGFPPRTAVGHLTLSSFAALRGAGVLGCSWDDLGIGEARRRLEALRREWDLETVPRESEPARIAAALEGALPVIYHGGGESSPVATRWCGQLAENGKTFSHRAEFPELNHNEIVGWVHPEETIDRIALLVLENETDAPETRRGMEEALKLISGKARRVLRISMTGEGPLARIFAAVYLADFVSWFLAVRRGVDPTPVRAIDELKAGLAKGRAPGEIGPGAAARKESS